MDVKSDNILHYLYIINYALGISIGGIAVNEYLMHGNKVPLLIILAVVIAGPFEDFLVNMIENKPVSDYEKKLRTRLVDQLTSIGFLLFLLLAALESN